MLLVVMTGSLFNRASVFRAWLHVFACARLKVIECALNMGLDSVSASALPKDETAPFE